MTNADQRLNESQTRPEGSVEGDPSVGEEGLNKVLLRVEGQNENITTPPKEVEEEIAATARAIDGTILDIDDGS